MSALGTFLASVHYLNNTELYANKYCIKKEVKANTCLGKCQLKKLAEQQKKNSGDDSNELSIPTLELVAQIILGLDFDFSTHWYPVGQNPHLNGVYLAQTSTVFMKNAPPPPWRAV